MRRSALAYRFALSSFWLLFVFVAYFATLIGIAVVRARRMQAMSTTCWAAT